MTSDDAATQGGGVTAGTTGPLPLDTSVAHQARMYDYYLGGKDNYAPDSPRSAFDADTAVHPDAVKI
jgi:hypothetical protein